EVRFRGRGFRGLRTQLPPYLVDRHHRVGALVGIDPQDHHPVPSLCWIGTGRRARLSGGDATLLSSHAGRSCTSEGRQKSICPLKGILAMSQPPGLSDTASLTLTPG